jgi:hypothetical protein
MKIGMYGSTGNFRYAIKIEKPTPVKEATHRKNESSLLILAELLLSVIVDLFPIFFKYVILSRIDLIIYRICGKFCRLSELTFSTLTKQAKKDNEKIKVILQNKKLYNSKKKPTTKGKINK